MLATIWLAPGKGDPVGYLYDRVVGSGALDLCDGEVQWKWAEKSEPTTEERRRRTRLRLEPMSEIQPYDVERIYAAIWEFVDSDV